MKFNSLTNQELHTKMLLLVQEERRITLDVLHHLREAERRRLYAERGFPSLFEYARSLGYSEGAAHRRISSMRLMKELPEVEVAVQEGKLSLSALSQAQAFFRREGSVSREEKLGIVHSLEGASQRQCEAKLASLSTVPIPEERERAVADEKTELRLVLNVGLMEKLRRIQELKKLDDSSYASLLEFMADEILKKLDPEVKKVREKVSTRKTQNTRAKNFVSLPALEVKMPARSTPTRNVPTRYVPVAIERAVRKRDQGRCTFVSPATGERCASKRHLQLDHVKPFALGGESSETNLRLACPAHNRYLALQVFGEEQMRKYLGP